MNSATIDRLSFHVSVKALVFDETGRLLFLQEREGGWDLPGGRMEHGESPLQALARECREEIGVAGRPLDHAPHWAWSARHSDGFWKLLLGYRMALGADDIARHWRANDEAIAYRFVARDELAALPPVMQLAPLGGLWATEPNPLIAGD